MTPPIAAPETPSRQDTAISTANAALRFMRKLADDLTDIGDRRGVEITRMLITQWEYRVKALENAVCETCHGFKLSCNSEYRCTCPPKEKKR